MKIPKSYLWGLVAVAALGLGLAVWGLMGKSQVPGNRTPVVKVESGVASETEFRKEFGKDWKFIRGVRGNVTRITGGRIALQDVSEEGVRAFVSRLMPLYGVEPSALGPAEHTGSRGRMQHYYFPQEKEGFRVLNGGITVYFNLQEEVVNIEGNLIPLRGRLRQGQMAREKALAKAREQLNIESLLPSLDKAVVYPRSNGIPELVWVGQSGKKKDSLRVVVSASSGRVLETGPAETH